VSHGVRQAEHAGADHGGDIVERHLPPFGAAGRGLVLALDHLMIRKERNDMVLSVLILVQAKQQQCPNHQVNKYSQTLGRTSEDETMVGED
jgi:hypothetical protein